jgi:hypothetical protein
VRIRVLVLILPALAATATAASALQLHFPPQENHLLAACDTAAMNITSAVSDASRTQVQTITTELRVLKPGRLAGDIVFGRPGSNVTLRPGAGQADRWKFSCGHGESEGRVGAGPGPAPGQVVSTLNETLAACGRYTLTFTLDQAGRNVLARIGAAERRKRPASIAWAIALHYSPVH